MKITDVRFNIGDKVFTLDSTFFEAGELFTGSERSYKFFTEEETVVGYQIEGDESWYIVENLEFYKEEDVFASEEEVFEEFKRRAKEFGFEV
jgi:hypothetical protein